MGFALEFISPVLQTFITGIEFWCLFANPLEFNEYVQSEILKYFCSTSPQIICIKLVTNLDIYVTDKALHIGFRPILNEKM